MSQITKNHNTKAIRFALSGFRSINEAKRFSKMYALLQILNSQIDGNTSASGTVTLLQREWAYKELLKMNLPEGFDRLATFEQALEWFFENCR